MAYSLRLTDTLDAATRAKADALGISINALVGVALDAYLRGPGEPSQTPADRAPTPEQPASTTDAVGRDGVPVVATLQQLTRKQRRAPSRICWRLALSKLSLVAMAVSISASVRTAMQHN